MDTREGEFFLCFSGFPLVCFLFFYSLYLYSIPYNKYKIDFLADILKIKNEEHFFHLLFVRAKRTSNKEKWMYFQKVYSFLFWDVYTT